jgi:predicted outer membrane lipoprotein
MQTGETSTLPTAYCGIRCTEQKLCEIDSGRVMVLVAKEDIRRITLRYGTQAPHPMLQVIMGVILIGLGYFPALHFIHWLQHGGVFFTLEGWIMPLVVAGAWAIISALKRGYFLEIEQDQGTKRLAFGKKPEPVELERFVGEVERWCGVRVSRGG